MSILFVGRILFLGGGGGVSISFGGGLLLLEGWAISGGSLLLNYWCIFSCSYLGPMRMRQRSRDLNYKVKGQ